MILDSRETHRWLKLASDNQARIEMPALRDVEKRPDPSFVKAYMHNGYFTSLKAIVHFCNTRDVLPHCQPYDVKQVKPSRKNRTLTGGSGPRIVL